MFFGKKKQEEYRQDLTELKQQMALHAEKIESLLNGYRDDAVEASKEQSARTEQQSELLSNRMDELQKMQKRQVRSLEDFLETEAERTDRGEALREKVQACEAREEHLLALVGCYQEQMHLLCRQIRTEFQADTGKASAWEKQFGVVEEVLKSQMHPCALEQTGKELERVDFTCHQILKVIDTEDEELDSKVAEVFCPGFLYHGRVIKKAQIAAYRRIKDGDSDRD